MLLAEDYVRMPETGLFVLIPSWKSSHVVLITGAEWERCVCVCVHERGESEDTPSLWVVVSPRSGVNSGHCSVVRRLILHFLHPLRRNDSWSSSHTLLDMSSVSPTHASTSLSSSSSLSSYSFIFPIKSD